MLLPAVLMGTFWKSDWMAPHTPEHFIQAPYSRGWVFVDMASWAAGQKAGRETRGPGPPAASLVQRRGLGQTGRHRPLQPGVLAAVPQGHGHVPESDHCTAPGPAASAQLCWSLASRSTLPCKARSQ